MWNIPRSCLYPFWLTVVVWGTLDDASGFSSRDLPSPGGLGIRTAWNNRLELTTTVAMTRRRRLGRTHYQRPLTNSGRLWSTPTADDDSFTSSCCCSITAEISQFGTTNRDEVRQFLDTVVYPTSDYGRRSQLNQQDVLQPKSMSQSSSLSWSANDPQLSYTYGEFPWSSLDAILDALEEQEPIIQQPQQRRRLHFCDVGSGCGRLCLYLAMTRPHWHVWGMEASQALHDEAIQAIYRAQRAAPWIRILPNQDQDTDETKQINKQQQQHDDQQSSPCSRLTLQCGTLQQVAAEWLPQCDFVFCYATALASPGFCPSVAGMALPTDWTELYTRFITKPGALVLTIDRVLVQDENAEEDPNNNNDDDTPRHDVTSRPVWKLLKRLDGLSNREVGDSTCFVQTKGIAPAEQQ